MIGIPQADCKLQCMLTLWFLCAELHKTRPCMISANAWTQNPAMQSFSFTANIELEQAIKLQRREVRSIQIRKQSLEPAYDSPVNLADFLHALFHKQTVKGDATSTSVALISYQGSRQLCLAPNQLYLAPRPRPSSFQLNLTSSMFIQVHLQLPEISKHQS
jgi:hypothetical protein